MVSCGRDRPRAFLVAPDARGIVLPVDRRPGSPRRMAPLLFTRSLLENGGGRPRHPSLLPPARGEDDRATAGVLGSVLHADSAGPAASCAVCAGGRRRPPPAGVRGHVLQYRKPHRLLAPGDPPSALL